MLLLQITKVKRFSDLENEIKLASFDYLVSVQGNKVEHYETTLIKIIKGLHPEIIYDVIINSPKILIVQDWNTILHTNNISIADNLNSVPTYFHFDIDNINIHMITNS